MVKNLPASAGDLGSIPESEDPLEKEMATHSSILASRIPGTEEPGGLQSMGSQELDMAEHIFIYILYIYLYLDILGYRCFYTYMYIFVYFNFYICVYFFFYFGDRGMACEILDPQTRD